MVDGGRKDSPGPAVRETSIPGVGVRYEFETANGLRVGVVCHRSGLREFAVYQADDPDSVAMSVDLEVPESRTLAELLGGAGIAERLAELQETIEGLAVDRLPILIGSPYASRTIADTAARTRTGVSIVAVLRGGTQIPAPGPEQGLEAGDWLVVVGTPRGIEQLAVILRTG